MNALTDNIIIKGGWVMVPIIAGSIVALGLVVERIIYFRKLRLPVRKFADRVYGHVRKGNIKSAVDLCKRTVHPLARVFQAGLDRHDEPVTEIDRAMEREGNMEVSFLEKNLNFLMVIVGIEPMLGFLGTIVGLIRAFMKWEQNSTAVTVSQLAGGIYEAMITTAGGLIVAIPYFIVYHIFVALINRTTHELNHYGDEMLSEMIKFKEAQANEDSAKK